MDVQNFSAHFNDLCTYITRLHQQVNTGTDLDRDEVHTTFTAINTALEELHSTEEAVQRRDAAVAAAYQAVTAEQRRWRDLFEFAPDAYVVTDMMGVVQDANQGAVDLLGTPQPLLLNEPFLKFVPKGQQRTFLATLSRLQHTAHVREWEVLLQRADGVPFEAAVSVATVRDADERPVALRWLVRDITERKRMERELRGSEERFGMLAEHSDDVFWMIDVCKAETLYVSPAYEHIWGQTRQSFYDDATSYLTHVHPDDYPRALAEFDQQLQGVSTDMQYRIIRPDGAVRWIWNRTFPIKDATGHVVRVAGIGQDITADKQAEALLHQRNQELAVLNAADLALMQSLDLQVVLHTLLDYLGQLVPYDTASVMLAEPGMHLSIESTRGYTPPVYPPHITRVSFNAQANPPLHTALATQHSVIVGDTHTLPGWERRAGAAHMHSWMGVPLIVGGRVIGLYSVNKVQPHFFTGEHMRLAQALAPQAALAIHNAQLFGEVQHGQQQLQTLSQRLVQVQEQERRYVARELHDEIGQALTGLKFVLERVPQRKPTQLQPTLAEARRLVDDLLIQVRDLSLDLRPAMLDDHGLLPTLLWHFGRYTTQTGIKVQFAHVGLGLRVGSDVETTAYRIVQEALTNVARYAQVATVDVQVEADAERLQVCITDHGSGFDAARLLNAHTSNGLSGMRERALLVGGVCSIESTPRHGTRLVATLPLPELHALELGAVMPLVTPQRRPQRSYHHSDAA